MADADIRHRARSTVRTLVHTLGDQPMATQDRAHALLNAPLILPVSKRMSDFTTLLVNGVDEFAVQVICFTAAQFEQPGISEHNALNLDFQDGDMDDIRILAMGIKRCVAYIRKLFVRQHMPQEQTAFNMCVCVGGKPGKPFCPFPKSLQDPKVAELLDALGDPASWHVFICSLS